MIYFQISTPTELVSIKSSDIMCIEADGNYSTIQLSYGWRHTVTRQIGEISEWFHEHEEPGFIRLGRSLIVNINYICIINLTNKSLTLQGKGADHLVVVTAPRNALEVLKEKIEQQRGLNTFRQS